MDDGALQKKFDSLPWIRRTTIKTAFSLFKLLKWESGLEVFRAFRKSISMPLIKRARPELRAIYGDEFFEYTFDINSTGKDLNIMFIRDQGNHLELEKVHF